MSVFSVRLPNKVIHEIEDISKKLKVSRSEYVRRSVELMNNTLKEQNRRKKIQEISCKIRDESMRCNSEFDIIECDEKN